MIKVTYDPEVNMTYVKLRNEPVDKTYSPTASINIDVDFNGRCLGVEYFGTPAALRQRLLDDKDDELWTDLFEFVRNF